MTSFSLADLAWESIKHRETVCETTVTPETRSVIQAAHRDVWNFNLDEKLFVEVVRWGIIRERSALEPLNNGQGVWNYYITIPERCVSKELFETLWLADEEYQFAENCPKRLTHNYTEASFASVYWHGGITYYEKIGQVIGHRRVKLGCDYSHYCDTLRDYKYTFDEVAAEALETAKQLKTLYKL